jgi:hypothetical protein
MNPVRGLATNPGETPVTIEIDASVVRNGGEVSGGLVCDLSRALGDR